MPITIKRPSLKPREISFCKSTTVCMFISVCFAAALFLCMNRIVDTEDKLLTVIVFSLFAVYMVCCIFCTVKGASAYKYEDSMSALGKSIVYAANVIFCLMNLRFALALLLSAFGAADAVDKIVGSDGKQAFIIAQYIPWMCLLSGMLLDVFLGIFGTFKLLKNK